MLCEESKQQPDLYLRNAQPGSCPRLPWRMVVQSKKKPTTEQQKRPPCLLSHHAENRPHSLIVLLYIEIHLIGVMKRDL